jgi:hypothetical protein
VSCGQVLVNLPALGEVKTSMQLYQQHFTQTFAEILVLHFKRKHEVAEGISSFRN